MTLIELMVSMLLGLVLIGGATGLILANRQSYRTNEALSQVQESARTAFELLARDVREAGLTGCDNTGRVANVLRPSSSAQWWQNWFGVMGDDGHEASGAVDFGTTAATRVAGTDSIVLQGIQGMGLTVETHHPSSANIKISAPSSSIVDDDILMVCDFDHAAIFQVTQYNSHNVTLVHNRSVSGSPGNCSKGLGYPTDCDSVNGNPYSFGPNSQIARFSVVAWYVGNNGRPEDGGRSLYRVRLGAGAAFATEEIVGGVADMQLQYREQGRPDFRDAGSVDSWADVNAVRIELTMRSAEPRVASDPTVNSGRLERSLISIVTLRNRVP